MGGGGGGCTHNIIIPMVGACQKWPGGSCPPPCLHPCPCAHLPTCTFTNPTVYGKTVKQCCLRKQSNWNCTGFPLWDSQLIYREIIFHMEDVCSHKECGGCGWTVSGSLYLHPINNYLDHGTSQLSSKCMEAP